MRKQSEIFQYAGLGFELAVSILVCLGLGYWVDKKLDSEPYAMIAGALLGIVSGIWSLFKRFVCSGKK